MLGRIVTRYALCSVDNYYIIHIDDVYWIPLIKIYIKNFGCKVNAAELMDASVELASRGASVKEIKSHFDIPQDSSDTLLINSCTVTATADAKLRGFVRRVSRQAPNLKIVIGGCTVRSEYFDKRQFDSVEYIDRVQDAAELMIKDKNTTNVESTSIESSSHSSESIKHSDCSEDDEPTSGRSREFVRVQDGCDCDCAFCIVPSVRPAFSVDYDKVLAKVDAAIARGVRELVITGTNIGRYYSYNKTYKDLLNDSLIRANSAGARVRLSSIEPEDIDDEVMTLFSHASSCKHIHLPLQSGSDRILSAMKRRYNIERYIDIANEFRSRFPLGSITTDIMVGYPGETDADFFETIDVLKKIGFERVHCFKFSPRPGTSAEKQKKVTDLTVTERMGEILRLSDKMIVTRMERFLSERATVLVERASGGFGSGYSGEYFRVMFPCHSDCEGELVEVIIDRIETKGLFLGKAVSSGVSNFIHTG